MKKTIALVIFLFAYSLLNGQTDVSGIWYGVLNAAGSLHIVLHINKLQSGLYTATLDSPDQHASGIMCDKVDVRSIAPNNTTINFAIDKIKISYTGKLINDSTISGMFTQVINIPLDLHRTSNTYTAKVIEHPQTPKPPFPYKVENVMYTNDSLQYGATITIPQGNGPFPAVLLITGSGQQDRDETIFNQKPFAVIADALTRDGFVVLRVDDRGIGSSTGNFSTSTTADFVNDVNASFNYLKTRPEVNKQMGLLGHSEGAMIAPIVASRRDDVNFIVLLAAPGVKIIDLMAEQNAAVFKSIGVSTAIADSFKIIYKKVVLAITNTTDTATAKQNALQIINNWHPKIDSADLHALGFINQGSKDLYVQSLMKAFAKPWFKYFIQLNPQLYLTKLKKVKVLALNGSRDIQVPPQQNLPAVEAALKQGKTKAYEVKEMPGLNHLFQTCTKCTVQEYGELPETFAPIALHTITDWLNKNVK